MLWGQPSLQFGGYQMFFPWGYRGQGVKFTNKFSCELHISGAILLPPKLSSWWDNVSSLVMLPPPNAVQCITKSAAVRFRSIVERIAVTTVP